MSRYSEQVRDEYGRPVPGVSVYVYVWDSIVQRAGALEALTNDSALALANPLTTDEFGNYYFNSADGNKLLEFHYGGKVQFREQVAVGAIPLAVKAAAQPDSEAASVADLRADFNRLLAKMRTATLMATPASTGVFFDSTAGDTFTGSKVSIPADATLTTSATQVAFNSNTVKALDLKIKRSDASILDWAFDSFTVDATFIVTSFYNVDNIGAFIGTLNDTLGLYAATLHSHPGAATSILGQIYNANSVLATDGAGYAFTPGAIIRCKYVKTGNTITYTLSFPSPEADHVVTLTQVFAVTSYEAPRMFSAPCVRFVQANIKLTKLKVSASYPDARFAFVGDSITQGRFATDAAHGFAALIRADYPGQVMIAGAPSAMTSDWLTNIKDVVAMAPKYAFVMLGTNDFTNGRTLSAIETDYTAIMNSLIAGGITPIALAVPPKGNANVPTFNTWLAAQGWRFVDTYTPLLGSGTSMSGTYNSVNPDGTGGAGDGIHPNTAGHDALHNTVETYIAAQGL